MVALSALFDELSPLAIHSRRLVKKIRVGPSEGSNCALCSRKDTDEELVDGGRPMRWGLAACDGKSRGKVCYYCWRVWRRNFAAAFSPEQFIPQCAHNKSAFDAFSS